jgi:hypothetical protein
MSNRTAGQIQEIGGHIEEFAGAEIREKVMQNNEKAEKSSNSGKIALWVKETIDRLDGLVDKNTRDRIMSACGHNCCATNNRMVKAAQNRRLKFANEDAFLKAEIEKPAKGTRLELHSNMLVQIYTPHNYTRDIRCYCGLMRGLPEGVNASPTYCQCARGFVETYWANVLGWPVRVEVKETAISGGNECKFNIHLSL